MVIGIDIRTLMAARYSGVPVYTLSLIKEILKLGNLSGRNNYYKLFYNSFHEIDVPLPNVKMTNAEFVGWNYPNKFLNYLYFKLLNHPKIDRSLGADLFFMPHINMISLSKRSRSILTIHDLSFFRHPEFFNLKKNLWHYLINVRKLVKKFDKIAVDSESTKNDVLEICQLPPEKVITIYPGLGDLGDAASGDSDESRNHKAKEIKNKYRLPNNYILYLGTLEPRKNIDGLIRAYNELRKNIWLKDVKLVIAGDRGWKIGGMLKAWERSQYKDDIKFIGYVDPEDKKQVYSLASVFAFPSFYEGFGFPPLEAMACGLPVVASYSSSLPEILGDASLMVDPYNISEISQAIEQVLTNQEFRQNLIKKGLIKASEFTWEKTAKNYLELFNSVMDS